MSERNVKGNYRAKGDRVVIKLVNPVTDTIVKRDNGLYDITRKFHASNNVLMEGMKRHWEDTGIVLQGAHNVAGLENGDVVALKSDTAMNAERDARWYRTDDGSVIIISWSWDIACAIRDDKPFAVGDNVVVKDVVASGLVPIDGKPNLYKNAMGIHLPEGTHIQNGCGLIVSEGAGCKDLLKGSNGMHVWYTVNTGFPVKVNGLHYRVVSENEARIVCDGI